jgi:hypothetical protein
MRKNTVTIATAIAILSFGAIISGSALAGGSSSAPSKYNNAGYTASANQNRNSQAGQSVSYTITEFSSSSAKTTPKR